MTLDIAQPRPRSVLVTGGNGFVGQGLLARLASEGCELRVATRFNDEREPNDFATEIPVGDIGGPVNWESALVGCDTVVHLAGIAHVMTRTKLPISEYRRVNVHGTANLARQAAAAGVKRFVFLSSIKVNGESTHGGKYFQANDEPAPIDPYGVSKQEAEDALKHISQASGMEFVIIRPPLVYGPGVKGNFLSLVHWVDRGLPLPFGALDNRRSLVGLDNLVDLIVTCMKHPAARNNTFLVSDGSDVSIPQLLRAVAGAMGKPARLFRVPPTILFAALSAIGKRPLYRRLCENLQVDTSETTKLLGWVPPCSMAQQLQLAVEAYRGSAA